MFFLLFTFQTCARHGCGGMLNEKGNPCPFGFPFLVSRLFLVLTTGYLVIS
jgi:hypothetical protein